MLASIDIKNRLRVLSCVWFLTKIYLFVLKHMKVIKDTIFITYFNLIIILYAVKMIQQLTIKYFKGINFKKQ